MRARLVTALAATVGLALAGTVAAWTPASAAPLPIVFDGGPGTAAPPATLGPYRMARFGPDVRGQGDVTDVPGPTGDVELSAPLEHTVVGDGWATWSHDYAGDVYYDSGPGSVVLTLPTDTKAFYLYAEPEHYDTFSMSARASDGTISGPVEVDGDSGARYFGFYSPGAATLSSVTVTSEDDSSGFAVGEFGIAEQRQLAMVAMGDSYSSGEGNPPFVKGTDSGDDTCHRSREAWPRLVSNEDDQVHLVADIACSGATTAALTEKFKTERPQLKQLRALPTPQVITLTMGGNDLGFVDILRHCFVENCVNNVQDAEGRLYGAGGLRVTLTRAYRSIEKTRPRSRLLVVGYPNVFPTRQSASVNCGWLTDKERPALVQFASELQHAVSLAASKAGAEFVGTLHRLAGHELCTKHSWMYPIGIFGGQLRAHPTAKGQEALARRVEHYLDSN